ncbi:uncharacterized protein LOC108105357 [Drosophila eugracilis]|uniref:uncharacterized protein LOC108105357 n=1 Tax=Drosophila eugracilis TaxID=29029 RepID=UPI0007E5C225|nr:uncharacterized protein LOC108105357 [Drosophila eugracilis]
MPPKKNLEKKGRRRRYVVHLSDFLRSDEEHNQTTITSSNQSQIQSNESPKTIDSSIGTIPSNGHLESDVTPIMTPTPQSEDQEKASFTVHLPVHVWGSTEENTPPDGNYNVDTKEYPDLGNRFKRAKQSMPSVANLDDDETFVNSNPGPRFRGRRGRIFNPPVLANFLPDSVLSSGDSNKQQTVDKCSASVHLIVSQKTANDQETSLEASPRKIVLLRKDSTEQVGQKAAGQSSNGEETSPQQKGSENCIEQQNQSTGDHISHQTKSPDNSFQHQKKCSGYSVQEQQQQQKSSGKSAQQQQKSSINSVKQQEQKSHGEPVQQRQECPENSLHPQQQEQKSPGKSLQQQYKSSGKYQQQQQKPPGNHVQQQQQSIPVKKQHKLFEHSSQQQHQKPQRQSPIMQQQSNKSGNSSQQQPRSLAKATTPRENNSPIPVRILTGPRNQRQTQNTESVTQTSISSEKMAKSTENSSPIPVRILTGPRSHRLTQSIEIVNYNSGDDEDDDVVPPTPNDQSQRLVPRGFAQRNNNQRMVRNLQSVSQEFTQSSPEGSPEEQEVPCQMQRSVHQQMQPYPVKRLQGTQTIRNLRQIALRSVLNSNAQEFRPRVQRATGGSNQDAEVLFDQPRDYIPRSSRITRRRRRQRFLRTLNSDELAPMSVQDPIHGMLSLPQPQPINYYSAPSLAPVVLLPVAAASPSPPQQQANPPTQAMIPPATIKLNTIGTPPAMIYYHPQTGGILSSPQAHIPHEVSQSVFRLASLPSTGVGTPDMDIFTDWPPPSQQHSPHRLPSSISGPSQFSHTLSSLPAEGQVQQKSPKSSISQDQDLLYSKTLLDMDREDHQETVHTQWELESQLLESKVSQAPQAQVDDDALGDPNASVANDHLLSPLERHKLFRAPTKHDQNYPKPDLNCVPSSIKKLHHLISSQYSDYSFVYALSAQLCQESVPMDCYVYLKMVLLASIVSIETDEVRAPISLCIIATDSLMANRLMNKVGQLAPRFVGPHDYGLQPTFNALPTRFNWVVAGPLLMAQQGVYYAGDWIRLSKEQSCQLEKCIENGAVPIPQLQIDQPLEAAVWTHWQPENSNNQTLTLAKLCPIFGMPIYMGDQVNESLWNSIIQQYSIEGLNLVNDDLNIPEDDMRMLIHLLHQRKTTYTDKAQHMLQKYYVISRKERPNVFSSKTYIVLKQFAESFAKLALRLEVLESDVCVAIFHCEHFVQRIFGAKDQQGPPAVITFNVISRIDPYMNEYVRWLLEYLDRYEDEELGMHAAKRRRTDSWDMP